MMLQVISAFIAHKKDLPHVIVWPRRSYLPSKIRFIALMNGKQSAVVVMDFTKAFDKVSHTVASQATPRVWNRPRDMQMVQVLSLW